MPPQIKGVPVAPLTGALDLRSEVDLMGPGTLRMRQNLQTTGQNKLRRGCGWSKLLDQSVYNNQDFHDQLLHFTDGSTRKPPTLLYQAESLRGVRYLIAGTQSQIAILNEYSGDYRILGSGYGGTATSSASAPRFHAAQVNDVVAFTNDFNKPMYHVLENGDGALLKTFDELDLIGVTRAGVIWAWMGCLFLADVEMDGGRNGNCVLWSNFQDPTGFDPANLASITGRKFLNPGERVLAGMPFGNSFLIYTTQNIWEMVVVGGDKSFDFAVKYPGAANRSVGVLRYPNTLVHLGDEHGYLAEDGLYTFSPYYVKPLRVEWAHLATPLLMDNIDTDHCSVHVAHFHDYEMLVSVARVGATDECPDITMRFNTQYRTADVVDAGFTAFCNYQSFRAPTIRDFIIENGICTLAGLTSAGYPIGNEGLPKPLPTSSAPFTPDHFYTDVTQTIDGQVVEDWAQTSASIHSLCALLGSQTFDDVCRKCAGPSLLVAASSLDWCLKQVGGVFHREVCLNPTAVGVVSADGYTSSIGSYQLQGIDSILRFAPMYIALAGDPYIQLDQVRLDFEAREADQPGSVALRVGISSQPTDPNGDKLLWHQHSSVLLKLLSARTAAQHRAGNSQPSEFARWHLYRKGRMIYIELKVSGTGGDADFSRMTCEIKPVEAAKY